jgi:hypothetical protein
MHLLPLLLRRAVRIYTLLPSSKYSAGSRARALVLLRKQTDCIPAREYPTCGTQVVQFRRELCVEIT